jgi:hypothetical protein
MDSRFHGNDKVGDKKNVIPAPLVIPAEAGIQRDKLQQESTG